MSEKRHPATNKQLSLQGPGTYSFHPGLFFIAYKSEAIRDAVGISWVRFNI